jgi:hypothetical protein
MGIDAGPRAGTVARVDLSQPGGQLPHRDLEAALRLAADEVIE